jgi:hypothetical protein
MGPHRVEGSKMSESTTPVRWRRYTIATLGAAVAVLGAAGPSAAMAAGSDGGSQPSVKIVEPNMVRPQAVVLGSAVTLGPGAYASGIVTCPANTLVWGGGETNTAPGTLVLTDSAPISDTQWLVFVKSNDTANTYAFTPRAICR